MAGDWIKITHGLSDKPEVHQMSSILKLDPDAVVGKLLRVWAWFDTNTTDGHAVGVTFVTLDRLAFCDGFGDAMNCVGWLDQDGMALQIPNFERHNSETAKRRALAQKRKVKQRSKDHDNVTMMSRSERDEFVTREEKRREEIKDICASGDARPCNEDNFSDGFVAWWDQYPQKKGKQQAWKIWKSKRLESKSAEVLEKTKSVILSEKWNEDAKFCPHGSTFLNQERWKDAEDLSAPSDPQLAYLNKVLNVRMPDGSYKQMTRAELNEERERRIG